MELDGLNIVINDNLAIHFHMFIDI